MRSIASRGNPFVRSLAKLARAGGDARSAIVEGVHLGAALLASGLRPRECVVAKSELARADVAQLVDAAAGGDGGARGTILDDRVFDAISGLEEGVGLLFVVDVPDIAPPAVPRGTAVLLDRVQDPGNVGAILRSAAAAGIREVYASPGCARPWSSKVLRAAMGAHFHLRIAHDVDLAALVDATGLPVLATAPRAPRAIYDVDLAGDVLWLFGHEGQGIDAGLLARATPVAIPQPGPVESLNVAASAAVCFFEQARQRRARRA